MVYYDLEVVKTLKKLINHFENHQNKLIIFW